MNNAKFSHPFLSFCFAIAALSSLLFTATLISAHEEASSAARSFLLLIIIQILCMLNCFVIIFEIVSLSVSINEPSSD